MARVQRALGLLRLLGQQNSSGALASAQAAAGTQFTRAYAVEHVAPAATYTDIEDEWYLRQRSQITLGNRHPNPAEGAWISPSAVVVGDVDLYDKVNRTVGSRGFFGFAVTDVIICNSSVRQLQPMGVCKSV